MTDKTELYRRLKLAGLLSFIPFVLVGAPLAGFLAGAFLVEKLSFPAFIQPLAIGLGLLAAILNVVKIIRLSLKVNREA